MSDFAELVAGIGTRLDGRPLLLMSDVDGTLAPIAPRPEEARVPSEARAVLQRLAGLNDVTLALVSGRAANDTMQVAGVAGAWIVGNHGFEVRSPDGKTTPLEQVMTFEQPIARAASALVHAMLGIEGALVENKRWTLSLHYRLVAEAAVPTLIARAREIAAASGLRVTEGRKVVELRPPIEVDKGTAVIGLAERFDAVGDHASLMFAGDDRTDEDAFRALRRRQPRAVTIRILPDSAEGTGQHTEAEFQLPSTSALVQLLEWIAARRDVATPRR